MRSRPAVTNQPAPAAFQRPAPISRYRIPPARVHHDEASSRIHSRSPVRPSPACDPRMGRESSGLPRASHPAVTRSARQGRDSPMRTGPETTSPTSADPPSTRSTQNMRVLCHRDLRQGRLLTRGASLWDGSVLTVSGAGLPEFSEPFRREGRIPRGAAGRCVTPRRGGRVPSDVRVLPDRRCPRVRARGRPTWRRIGVLGLRGPRRWSSVRCCSSSPAS